MCGIGLGSAISSHLGGIGGQTFLALRANRWWRGALRDCELHPAQSLDNYFATSLLIGDIILRLAI